MLAGATFTQWLCFHLLVAVLLAFDFLFSGKNPTLRRAILLTIGWIAAALAYAFWTCHAFGHTAALEYLAGYSIEQTLSLDNLFVFLILFRGFNLPPLQQRHVLFYGVIGAILMRGIFIFGGIALIQRFSWIQYIFAAVLLFAAIRMLTQKPNSTPGWLAKLQNKCSGSQTTPLLMAIIAIELTDVLFALDSVPAVIAVTHQTFIAYTSNIFAVMGLRALYFVLAGTLSRLRHLHVGLATLLIFIAAKMLLAGRVNISTPTSLAVILTILAISITTSLLWPKNAQ